jgi:hypothetical protein
LRLNEVHSITETTGVVAGEPPKKSDRRLAVLSELVGVLPDAEFNLMLALQLGHEVMSKFRRLEELDQLRSSGEDKLMLIWDHAEKLIDTVRNLPLWTVNRNLITGLLSAGEVDLAVVLLLQVIDLRKSSNKLTMIEAVNADNLRCVLRIL